MCLVLFSLSKLGDQKPVFIFILFCLASISAPFDWGTVACSGLQVTTNIQVFHFLCQVALTQREK